MAAARPTFLTESLSSYRCMGKATPNCLDLAKEHAPSD